jgi:hypothetical protein
MGVVDQVGRGVEAVTEGLKSAPLCLAAILLSGIFSALFFFTYSSERTQSHEIQLALIRECFPPGRFETRDEPASLNRGPRFGGPR